MESVNQPYVQHLQNKMENAHLSITHQIVSTSEKVKFDNVDTDGEILMTKVILID